MRQLGVGHSRIFKQEQKIDENSFFMMCSYDVFI